jgi:hypothetical protein
LVDKITVDAFSRQGVEWSFDHRCSTADHRQEKPTSPIDDRKPSPYPSPIREG